MTERFAQGAPANDNFADRIVLTGAPIATTGTNVGATKESGELNHANNAGGKSVWWSWTAPGPGSVIVNRGGTNFFAVLAVYTGDSVEALSSVASSQSLTATFVASGGTTYQIAVDGWGGESGSIELSLQFTAYIAPSIDLQPVSRSALAGTNASFTTSASGVPTPTLKWQRLPNGSGTWVDLTDGGGYGIVTRSWLTISSVTTAMDGDQFRCVATNAVDSVPSDAATLTVTSIPPAITTQPPNRTVLAGHTASFATAASGTPAPTFQWQHIPASGSGWIDLANDSIYSGVTSESLRVFGPSTAMSGDQFRCVASNAGGSTTSDAAMLTVLPLPASPALGVNTEYTVNFTTEIVNAATTVYPNSTALVDFTVELWFMISTDGAYELWFRYDRATTYLATDDAWDLTLAIDRDDSGNEYYNIGLLLYGAGGNQASGYSNSYSRRDLEGQWNHFAAMYDANTKQITLALNGVIKGTPYTASVTEFPVFGNNLAIGGFSPIATTGFFPGWIDEVRISDVARYSANFTPSPHFAVDANTRALWHFSEGSAATSFTDSGPYGFTLAASNGAKTVVPSLTDPAPMITSVPADQSVAAGDSASFSITSSDASPPAFQWQRRAIGSVTWTNLSGSEIYSGVTSPSLTVSPTTVGMSGDQFRCIAVNNAGTTTTTSASLTVNSSTVAPAITTHPASQTVTAGANATFTVAATGTPAPSYQWQRLPIGSVTWSELTNDATYSGATTSTLTVSSTTTGMTGDQFRCVATNTISSATSNAATLTVNLPDEVPVITSISAPRQVVNLGQSLTLNVTAIGTPPPAYQWKRNGLPIAGATAASYVIGSATALDNGYYQVVASNSVGTAASAVVFVNVTVNAAQVLAWGENTYGQATPPAGLTGVVSLAAGNSHSLALKGDGTVVGWGRNDRGQIIVPPALTNVVGIAAGESHSLALKSDGTVVAWGWNISGQTDVPPTLTNVVAIAASGTHSQALKSDGTIVQWGFNPTLPVLSNVIAIADGDPNLALKSDGSVVVWGFGSTDPIPPADLTNVVAVAAGYYPSLVLKADGTVEAWGATNDGITSVPPGLTNVVGIAAGVYHSLALRSDGTVVAWGKSTYGQTDVPGGLVGVVGITAGFNHTVVLRNTTGDTAPTITVQPVAQTISEGQDVTLSVSAVGTLQISYQWRKGGTAIPGATKSTLTFIDSQLSDTASYDVVVTNGGGTKIADSVALTVNPAVVTARRRVVSLGRSLTLAAPATAGTTPAYQWKHNGLPILGATTPGYTIANAAGSNNGWYQVVINDGGIVTTGPVIFVNVVVNPAQVRAWGSDATTYLPLLGTQVPQGLDDLVSLAAGEIHSLALKGDGTVVGWGNDGNGEATSPPGLNDVVAVAAAANFSLALKSDGTVAHWGFEGDFQIPFPADLSDVVGIVAGYRHALALKSDGTVVAWGVNLGGQASVPLDLTNIVGIAAGVDHSIALRSDGTLVIWGLNTYGQTSIPAGLTNVVKIAAGYYYNLALKSDGTVEAWGEVNKVGSGGVYNEPPGLTNVVDIAAGDSHALALKRDGTVSAWGNYQNGEINLGADLTSVVGLAGGRNFSLVLRDLMSVSAPSFAYGQPVNQTVQAAGSGYMRAVASSTGTPTPTYQWQRSVNGGSTWIDLADDITFSGVTTATLTITNATTAMGGNLFHAIASNSAGLATSEPAVLTVSLSAQTITFAAIVDKIYGDASFAMGASASSGLPVTFSLVSGPASLNGNTVTITGAGTVTVRASQAGDAAFAAAPDVERTFNVAKATLTVTAEARSRPYGTANPALTFVITGFVNADDVGSVTGTPALDTTATATSAVGTYPITAAPGTLAAANYSFNFANGELTVTKAALTVTAADQTRAYGAADPALTLSFDGFVNNDTIAVLDSPPSATTTSLATSVPGSYPITVSGGAAANYALTYNHGALTITKAPLTAKANDKIKQQGTANPTLTISYSGFANGESAAVLETPPTASTLAVTDSPVGTYPITLAGGSDDNYALTLVDGTLTVTLANIAPTITTHPVDPQVQAFQNAVFTVAASGLPVPTIQWQRKATASNDWIDLIDTTSIIGAQTETLTLSAVTTANDGDQFRAVAANGETPNAVSNAATLGVGKVPATVALSELNHTYDGLAKNATASTTPSGLTVTVTYAGATTPPINAGSYTVEAIINDANYQGSATGSLTVAKAGATVTLSELVQTYDGAAKSISATTLPSGLAVVFTYDGNTTPPANAGSYLVTGTIVDTNHEGLSLGALTIAKAVATITLGGLSQTYNGTPQDATAITSPAGLSVLFTYNGTSTPPVDAGSYEVIASVSEINYTGSANAIFTIANAAAEITISETAQPYNGAPKSVTVVTNPAALTTVVTYNGGATPPTLVGSHAVAVSVVDPNYSGFATATLEILPGINPDQPGGIVIVPGGDETTLTVQSSGTNPGTTYQWQEESTVNGLLGSGPRALQWVDVGGATAASYTIANVQRFHARRYRVIVTTNDIAVTSLPFTVEFAAPPPNNARLLNLSTRGLCLINDQVLIPGFVVSGTGTKKVLIRAVGPTLSQPPYNVPGTLPDPRIALKRLDFSTTPPNYEDIAANDNWGDNPNAPEIPIVSGQLGAFPITDPREAALLVDLAPGQYTVVADGVGGTTGVAIVELYDADAGNPTTRLINISNRGFVGVGAEVMIPGFVISSEGPKTVLLRVVGPTLADPPYNVGGTLADPQLQVFKHNFVINTDDLLFTLNDWNDNPDAAYTAQIAQQVGAFALAEGSKDAAFVVTLLPGVYTVVGSAADGVSTGVIIVEVYVVP